MSSLVSKAFSDANALKRKNAPLFNLILEEASPCTALLCQKQDNNPDRAPVSFTIVLFLNDYFPLLVIPSKRRIKADVATCFILQIRNLSFGFQVNLVELCPECEGPFEIGYTTFMTCTACSNKSHFGCAECVTAPRSPSKESWRCKNCR